MWVESYTRLILGGSTLNQPATFLYPGTIEATFMFFMCLNRLPMDAHVQNPFFLGFRHCCSTSYLAPSMTQRQIWLCHTAFSVWPYKTIMNVSNVKEYAVCKVISKEIEHPLHLLLPCSSYVVLWISNVVLNFAIAIMTEKCNLPNFQHSHSKNRTIGWRSVHGPSSTATLKPHHIRSP